MSFILFWVAVCFFGEGEDSQQKNVMNPYLSKIILDPVKVNVTTVVNTNDSYK